MCFLFDHVTHSYASKGNLLSSKTIPDMMPSPSTTNSAAAMAERRNHEMFAERHADRIFQVTFYSPVKICAYSMATQKDDKNGEGISLTTFV